MSLKKIVFVLFIFFVFPLSISANEIPLKAAFIRDNQLWLKDGQLETKLTQDNYVFNPQWSSDGRYLAYLVAEQIDSSRYLNFYDLEQKAVVPLDGERIETTNFKWSPFSNQLAFLVEGGGLNLIQINDDRIEGFQNISLGVSDFEWFPNGREFIVSSQAQLLPTGWGPIRLFKVPVEENLDFKKTTPFYTIETNNYDFFAIDVKHFNWSSDGKWLSFIASPTASLSNDTTTLCVLDSTGQEFHILGKMLGNKHWTKWNPQVNQLAFISGEGRYLIENKQLIVNDVPQWNHNSTYTPKGYVDLAIEWLTSDEFIVARAKEDKNWKDGPVPISFTTLYKVNIKTNEQTQITFPSQTEYDRDPQRIASFLSWSRRNELEDKMDIFIRDDDTGIESLWLQNIDAPPIFIPQ